MMNEMRLKQNHDRSSVRAAVHIPLAVGVIIVRLASLFDEKYVCPSPSYRLAFVAHVVDVDIIEEDESEAI
jgi:hypothetical protein